MLIIIITGKIIANARPFFRSPAKRFVIQPIAVGPAVHPISPDSASSANIAVVPEAIFCDVRLIVAGHIADTERPHSAQPTSESTAFGEKLAKMYEIMHIAAERIRYFSILIRELSLLKMILPIPIRTANAIGPMRSPTVFDTLRPVSANVEAHWLIAISLAPEQIIMITEITNNLFFNRSESFVFFASS